MPKASLDQSVEDEGQKLKLKRIRDLFDAWLKEVKANAVGVLDQSISDEIDDFHRYFQRTDRKKAPRDAMLDAKVVKGTELIKAAAKDLGMSGYEKLTPASFLERPIFSPASLAIPLSDPGESAISPQPLEFGQATAHETLRAYVNFVDSRINRAREAKDRTLLRDLYPMVARAHRTSGNWFGAEHAFGKAAEICLEEGDGVSAARNFLDQGTALYRAREFERAEVALMKGGEALEKAIPKHADLRTELKIWDYLGITLCRMNRNEEALSWFNRGSALRRTTGYESPLETASHLARKGVVLLALEQRKEAMKSLRAAMKIRIEKGARRLLARSLKYVALSHYQEGAFEKALVLWRLCRAQQEAAEDYLEIGWLNFYIAGAFENLKTDDQSKLKDEIDSATVIGAMTKSDREAAAVFQEIYGIHLPGIRLREAETLANESYLRALEIAKRLAVPDLEEKAQTALDTLRTEP